MQFVLHKKYARLQNSDNERGGTHGQYLRGNHDGLVLPRLQPLPPTHPARPRPPPLLLRLLTSSKRSGRWSTKYARRESK